MKNKIVAILLVFILVSGFSVHAEKPEDEIIIHVSVSGNDEATGTEKQPLKTFAGAKKRVRSILKENKDAAVKVIFHEGDYRFDKSVTFDKDDSPNANNPVIYQAAEGETVNFKGSKAIDISKLKPVSDERIKSRLKEDVVDFVGEISLKAYGINEVLPFIPNTQWEATEYTAAFLNGVEQPLSEYPNGNGNYATWDAIVNADGVISVPDETVRRWGQAKDLWIGGYFQRDYQYERCEVRSIDTEKKEISFARSGVRNDESKRWKVFNILEELDSPGEWYIDKTTMMFYYYPPYNVKNATFEVTTFRDSMFVMKGVENLVFKNINFSQVQGKVFQMHANTKNIKIDQCSFENISGSVIRNSGSKTGTFEGLRNYLDAPSGIKITNCYFYNIGGSVIFTYGGGNRQTLTSSEIEIKNNYIERAAQKTRYAATIYIEGAMNVSIEHNTIHTLPFHAINFFGNDHVIRYNDISNVCMETTDAAAVYAGQSQIQRGHDISYNYIHDYRIKGEGLKLDQVPGIYLDDSFCGVNMHHNIIEDGGIGIYINKGQDNQITSNTIINCDRPFYNTAGGGGSTDMSNNAKEALKYPGWKERYPMIEETLKAPSMSVRNELVGNVTNGEFKMEQSIVDSNTIEDNYIYENEEIFVNPKVNDYRLKAASEAAESLPEVLSDKNFRIEDFGVEKDATVKEQQGTFKKLYPKNGELNVDSGNVLFQWEEVKGADQYRLVIAKDQDFKDIVVDKICYYPFQKITELESANTSYYYTVYARNTLSEEKEWEASGARYRFTTAKFGNIELYDLSETVEYVKSMLPGLREGDEPGFYKNGSLERINTLLNKADKMLSWESEKDGTQKEIDKINADIKEAVSEKYINSGYMGIEEMVDNSDFWVEGPDGPYEGISVQDNTVTVNAVNDGYAVMYKEPQSVMASKNTIRKFQMNCDLTSGWAGLGLRTELHDKAHLLYTSNNPCYFFAIKENVIEFQKNPGGIIVEIPNTFIKSGEWHEVEFGVINTKTCPVIILNVDGKEVIKYYDTAISKKVEEGAFSLSVVKGRPVMIRPSKEVDKPFPYNDLIESEPENSNNFFAYSINSKKALWNNEEIKDNKPLEKNGVIYLPLRLIAEKLGMTVSWKSEGYAEIVSGGDVMKFYPDKDELNKNGTDEKLSACTIVDNGCMMISAEDIQSVFDLELKALENGIVIIGEDIDKIDLKEITDKLEEKEVSDNEA